MKAAIAQLEISLENLENNIPIRRAEGDVEQADAWAVNASEIRQALVTLKAASSTWKHPLEDCCPPHFINDGLSAANEYWRCEYISLRDKLIKESTDQKIALSRIHQALLDARACGCEISLEDAISDAENSLRNKEDQERKSPASDGSEN